MSNIKQLSSRKLAAQLIVPRLSINDYLNDKDHKDKIHALIREGVGGFCVFGGSPQLVRNIIDDLQIMADIPLIFCADFENGLTMRLDNGTGFPHAMALGKTNDLNMTEKVASLIAQEAKLIGIHWNLAPVCDINSNADNPVINIRSFGEDLEAVSDHANAYIKGTQSEKCLSCAKHFPGHGDTDVDSHIGLPIINKSLEEIRNFEMYPFIKAIENKVRSIMIGHLSVPALDDTGKPASLSKNVIGLLKNDLKYNGIVLTDALDMKAITDKYNSGDAALEAFRAGNDIILMPEDPLEALESLYKELSSNNDKFEQALASAERIYKAKQWCGVTLPVIAFDNKNLEHYAMKHQRIALEAAEPAVRISGSVSLPLSEKKEIAGFTFVFGDEMDKGVLFFKMLAQAIENDIHFGFMNDKITDEELDQFTEELKYTDIIIFCFFVKGKAYQERIEITDKINEMIKKLSKAKEVITIIFGNPYLDNKLEQKNIIYTYSDSLPSIAAAVMKLSGRTANVN
jgi:beta-N-acetylhexosaminidase